MVAKALSRYKMNHKGTRFQRIWSTLVIQEDNLYSQRIKENECQSFISQLQRLKRNQAAEKNKSKARLSLKQRNRNGE